MNKLANIEGNKFGRLTVIKKSETDKKKYVCVCECGNETEVNGYSLIYGFTKSCGCLYMEMASELGKNNTIHGLSHDRLYSIWHGMVSRCTNKKDEGYQWYGAKGIEVCKDWYDNFMNFYTWAISNGYDTNLEIERKDLDGDYCPENCTWVTEKEQCYNRSSNRWITIKGQTKALTQWAEQVGITSVAFAQRIKNGWSEDQLLSPARR